MIDLILKDIQDPHVRENFFRLSRFLNNQIFFDGDFRLYDVQILEANDFYPVKHGLNFIPEDVILLAAEGNFNFFFRYQDFDKDFIYINNGGPARIRFLAGKLKDPQGLLINREFDLVAPGTGAGAPPAVSAPLLIDTFNTDVGTSVGDLVRVSAADTVEGISNNSSGVIPNGVFGVVYNKPTAITAEVLFCGLIDGYAGFTAGSPLFVSTLGVPTHTPPATGVVQQIGFAVSTTGFFMQLMQPQVRA